MTSAVKLFGLIEAVRYVVRYDVPGDIVECGVWRGGSMQAAALTLLEAGATEPRAAPVRHLRGDVATDRQRPSTRRQAGVGDAGHDTAGTPRSGRWPPSTTYGRGWSEVGYPSDRIHYHQGLVEQTIPAQAPDRIAILRLDTDWYESTRHELEHLYHRLSPGGVLIIDDYGHWDGARQAVDEFLDKTGEPLLLLPLSFGRIAVKHGR